MGTGSVSVVVIGRRSGAALDRALDSVLSQDHRPLELVLLGNGAPIDSPHLATADVPVRTGTSEVNLGVAGGRNAARRLATGDLLLFLDDDAVLAPHAIARAVAVLRDDPRAAAVAFRFVDPDTDTPVLRFHPAAHDSDEARFETQHVLGGGHLVRADVFDALGGFWDGYFREMEEVDLSWRLLDTGRTIIFEPSAVVRHPDRTARHLRHSLTSNLLLTWRLLPAPLAVRHSTVLLGLLGVRAVRCGEVGDYLRGLRDAAAAWPRVRAERRPLGPATVAYLRRVHAPQGAGKRLKWSLRPLTPPAPLGGQPGAAA